jgi:hypothetical protein
MEIAVFFGIVFTIWLIGYVISKYLGQSGTSFNRSMDIDNDTVIVRDYTEANITPVERMGASGATSGSDWENDYISSFKAITATQVAKLSPWAQLRRKVIIRDGEKCIACGSISRLTVDHIRELSLGGTNEMSNLRTLCAGCHEDRHERKFMDREFAANPHYGEDYQTSPKVTALNAAMIGDAGVGIKYVDREGLYSERVIHPLRIWKSKFVYVSAYDDLDRAERDFRVSRLKITISRENFYDNATNSYTSSAWVPDEQWLRKKGR